MACHWCSGVCGSAANTSQYFAYWASAAARSASSLAEMEAPVVAVALEGALSDGGGAAAIGAALTTVVPDAAVEVESSDSTVVPDAAVEVDSSNSRFRGRVAAAPGDEQGGARCQRSQHQATTHGSPGLDHVYVPARGCRAHTIGFGGGSCQLDPAGSLTREYPRSTPERRHESLSVTFGRPLDPVGFTRTGR